MAYTTIDNPELYFQTKIYTADQQANRAITLDGSENMQPDWIWFKNRTQAVTHMVFDSVRGVTKYLATDQTTAEGTGSDHLISFDTNGFTVDTSWNNYATGDGYVAWCWKASGSTASNTDGSITSTVSANTTAGFSIVSYTGTGSAATIGHGLGSTPQVIIIKNRSATFSWEFGHSSIGFTKKLKLDTTSAEITDTGAFNNTAPTSSVYTVGNNSSSNGSGNNMIAYCFANKQGAVKCGSYTGNGSSSDGTFVYTGFRPAWIMRKNTDGGVTENWVIEDNKRNTFNPANEWLAADSSGAEGANNFDTDFLSNGFKMRSNNDGTNRSGTNYIYMAIAEAPFVNSNGVPANAR